MPYLPIYYKVSTTLCQSVQKITEILREQKQPDEAQARAVYEQVQTAYESVIAQIPAVL